MYSIDFSRLIWWTLPHPLRKTKLVAWLNSLISPVKTIHALFILFTAKTYWDVITNGQVCKLRAGLNREFDPSLDRILIEDAVIGQVLFIYLESENNPVYLPEFISGSAADFIVKVPTDLMGIEVQIRAYLDKFKLPSKRYQIEWI